MLQRTKQPQAWRNFSGTDWQREINVRDFIVSNVTPYVDGPEFLAKPTERTLAVWEKLQPYFREEAKKGVLDVDVTTPSSLTSHAAGYIDRDNEVVVGLQTDKPFRRAICHGGWGMIENGLRRSAAKPTPRCAKPSPKCRKARNAAVFDLYTPESARAAFPSSPGCPTPMAAAASSATTGVLRCTAWTA
jgi:formate C-acetyltransferase